ncbi:3-hydroxyacyl-ACP dehydratase FabZ [Actinoalloteichus hymeniacidonis]|uniref:3-hydroxyacyl-[acyl-carrier-protein] dehydratase n=1 Tax=Actinoalloteichus hymeniacidonis TaxID=340345 RepID=A0AAC9HMC2_9PSEU|nr:3-hydroxyacyl-ACP dehydratase FabZ [Actinoalloteichus hymeniacidonis]AOS61962.1 3-hydroxyacyl-(acyl-carrier-protein) dehydratase [Actinoalloteichus hymeniacidonis]MBB5910016.1 3-hydroxyacyl-[acyl-carrier-protein] dehydratase [Actinoalloteichus hymeniacidonis]
MTSTDATPGVTPEASTEAAPEKPKTLTNLSNDDIKELIPHRWPMLLLDRIEKVEPGVEGVAIKNVAGTEFWFQGHFPDEAILPGIVVIEAMAQLAGVVFSLAGAGKISYLTGVRSMRFKKRIVPGDRIVLSAVRTAGARGVGEYRVVARTDDQVAAEGVITITDPGANNTLRKV